MTPSPKELRLGFKSKALNYTTYLIRETFQKN